MSYPTIDTNSIWSVVEFAQLAKEDPSILDDAPYPKEFTEVIHAAVNRAKAKRATTNSIEDIEAEISNIYDELDELRDNIKADEEGQLMVSYMRLRSQVLTKMIEIKERTFNLKKMKEFQDRVFFGLDKVCSADQRTQFTRIMEGKEA